jgi:hypothetical protein
MQVSMLFTGGGAASMDSYILGLLRRTSGSDTFSALNKSFQPNPQCNQYRHSIPAMKHQSWVWFCDGSWRRVPPSCVGQQAAGGGLVGLGVLEPRPLTPSLQYMHHKRVGENADRVYRCSWQESYRPSTSIARVIGY